MPTIFREDGYRFFFYSNEGSPREPIHVHVRRAEAEAKFWLHPEIVVVDSYGFNAGELRQLSRLIEDNKALIEETWHDYFGNGRPLR